MARGHAIRLVLVVLVVLVVREVVPQQRNGVLGGASLSLRRRRPVVGLLARAAARLGLPPVRALAVAEASRGVREALVAAWMRALDPLRTRAASLSVRVSEIERGHALLRVDMVLKRVLLGEAPAAAGMVARVRTVKRRCQRYWVRKRSS